MLEIDIHERIVLCIEEGKKQGILKTSEYKELLGYLDEWFAEVEKRLTDGLKMPNDLEEAADKYAEKLTSEPYLQVVHKTDFIAGAKWQREQMLKGALHGWLDEDNEPPYDLNVLCEEKIPFGEFKHGDKVHIIVVKENKK